MLPLGCLRPSPTNPRKTFDEAKLAELAESIRAHGILQPLVVREVPPEGIYSRFEVVAGERRFRAAGLAGVAEVPCIVRYLSDADVLEIQVIENAQREDVHPLEECDGFRAILESGRHDVATLAAKLGKSEAYVRGRLSLVGLSPASRAALEQDAISLGHALILANLEHRADPNSNLNSISDQDQALEWLVYPDREEATGALRILAKDRQPGVREFRARVARDLSPDLARATFPLDDETLNPSMGACVGCAFRSGADLFDEEAGGRCLRRSCFQTKRAAFVERQKAGLPEGALLGSSKWSGAPTGSIDRSGWREPFNDAERAKARPMLVIDGPDAGRFIQVVVTTAKVSAKDAEAAGDTELAEAVRAEKAKRREELRLQRAETLARLRIFQAVLAIFDDPEDARRLTQNLQGSLRVLRAVAIHLAVRSEQSWYVNGEKVDHPGTDGATDSLGLESDERGLSIRSWGLNHEHFTGCNAGIAATWRAIFIAATRPEILVNDQRKQPPGVLEAFAAEAGIDMDLIRKEADWETLSKREQEERLKEAAAHA